MKLLILGKNLIMFGVLCSQYFEKSAIASCKTTLVKDLVMTSMELGEANDRVFSTTNSKQSGGAFGLLTDGLLTRKSVYTQTLILALVPHVNELFTNNV